MKSVLEEIKTLGNHICKCVVNDSYLKENKDIKKLTHTQYRIFKYLLDNQDKNVFQNELEKVLHISRATVSGVLHTMEKNKCIKRVINPEDTRTKKIILNENAKLMFDNGKKRMLNIEKKIKKDISKEELEQFFKTLDKMKKNLEKV